MLGELRSGISEADPRGTWAFGHAGGNLVAHFGFNGDDAGPNYSGDPNADDIGGGGSGRRSSLRLQRSGPHGDGHALLRSSTKQRLSTKLPCAACTWAECLSLCAMGAFSLWKIRLKPASELAQRAAHPGTTWLPARMVEPARLPQQATPQLGTRLAMRIPLTRTCIALLLGLVASCCIGCGQDNMVPVSGTVKYKDGSPIEGGVRMVRFRAK